MARPRKEPETKEPETKGAFLVKMTRRPYSSDFPTYEADVHPDEVHNYAAGGWQIKGV